MRRSSSSARVRERVLVALGSNLGDRAAYLSAARAAMTLLPSVAVVAASSIEETAPLGGAAQGPYLNQMVAIETTMAPNALLLGLQGIERRLGRVRTARWAARTIDLDIVRFGARTIDTPSLVVPHPGLAARDFWQREMAELGGALEGSR